MMKKLLILMALAFSAGCTTMSQTDTNIKAVDEAAVAKKAIMAAAATKAAVVRSPFQRISANEILLRSRNELPARFAENVVYISYSDPISGVLGTLSQQTGIPMALAQPVPPTRTSASSNPVGIPGGSSEPFQIEWRAGTLKALLDHVAQRLRMHWSYHEGRVEFIVTETRSFHVYLPVGDKKIAASIALSGAGGGSASSGGTSGGSQGGSSSGGGSASGSNSVSVSSNITVDPYTAIAKTVSVMLVENDQTGASRSSAASATTTNPNVVVNPELGMITVTASPPTLDRVGDYIESINKRFAQNIMIDVRVYSVTTTREAGAGLSATALLNTMGKYGISVAGAAPLQTNGSGGTLTINHTGPNSSGSLLVSALSQFGDVSLVRSGQVIAVNGQPAPMQLADEFTYLASSSTTQTVNVGQTTTLTPGSRTVGFTANFLPMILGDNRILLQYQIDLSSLLKLDQISSNGSTIQTPSITKQSLQQQAFVKDGQSIVLFGFESDRNSADSAATVGSFSRLANQQRNLLVIVMQVFGGHRENI